MAFYIKPPEGFGALEKLRTYALRRMNFLVEVRNCAEATDFQQLLEKGATAVDSDCLIEGSRKDRISHFLLRLICCHDVELSSYMVRAETELFCHRFSCMNSEELVRFLKATHRFLCRVQRHRKLQETNSPSTFQGSRVRPVLSSFSRSQEAYSVTVSNLLHVLNLILEAAGTWKLAVKYYMDYSSCVFSVPFQHALCLVASRQVMVDRGMAFVPFSNLHIVLAAMFEDILREGVRVAHHVPNSFLEDPRMRSISQEVYATFLRSQHGFGSKTLSVPGNGKIIREHQVDHLHHIFPPCMSHLHRTLRKKHRLRHFSRIQYTLFLKNIGLPVDDAIHFWRSEYSMPSCYHDNRDNRGGGCQHSWAKDERRYTYGIRHLYGLEGSRINYRAHSCKAIQMMQLGYGEEGGCPFKHFDDPSLQGLMDIEEIVGPQREEIDSDRQKGKYQMACRRYFHAKRSQIDRHCDNRAFHQLEKNLKEAGHLDGGCCQSGTCSQEPEVTRCTSKDGLVKHGSLDSVSEKNTNVQNLKDIEHESDDTLMKRSIRNNDKRTSNLQHSGNGNECTEVSVHKHLGSCKPSLNRDCASACDGPTTSCHIADEEIDTAESGIDVSPKCHSGDVTMLRCKSSAPTDLYSGSSCRCTKPLSMADSSMSKTKNKGNTLKRESAIASEDGGRKVQKISLDLNGSDVIVESAIPRYEADGKKNTIMHETKSVIVPSCEGDLVDSLSIEKSREEVLSSVINLDEDFNGFSFEGEEQSILRPSNFYYSFRRMMHDLNQNKLNK